MELQQPESESFQAAFARAEGLEKKRCFWYTVPVSESLEGRAQENFPAFFQVLACKEICFLFFLACGFLKRHTER